MAGKEKRDEQTEIAAVRRDTTGLRDVLFDELDMLRRGRSNSAKANATAKLCSTVIECVRMEIEVRRYLQSAPLSGSEPAPALGEPIELGE